MKRSTFSETQIIGILKLAAQGKNWACSKPSPINTRIGTLVFGMFYLLAVGLCRLIAKLFK